MYKCKECGKGVMVEGLPTPIRICNCTQEVLINGEKTIKPSAIILDLEGTAYGRSQFSN